MLIFPKTVQAWNTTTFSAVLKAEPEARAPADWPLHKAVSQASFVDARPLTATVFGSRETNETVEAKVGVFFTEIVVNCGCGDEPMPINGYCELLMAIDKVTSETSIRVVSD